MIRAWVWKSYLGLGKLPSQDGYREPIKVNKHTNTKSYKVIRLLCRIEAVKS